MISILVTRMVILVYWASFFRLLEVGLHHQHYQWYH